MAAPKYKTAKISQTAGGRTRTISGGTSGGVKTVYKKYTPKKTTLVNKGYQPKGASARTATSPASRPGKKNLARVR